MHFRKRAAQYPNKVAVVDGTSGKQISYKELDSKSSALALKLVSLGVQKDTIVGLLSARSIEYLIGMLGVMKAGGAYLPMDPKVPQDRIEFQLTDSSCNICLVNGLSLKDRLSNFKGATLRLDTFDYSEKIDGTLPTHSHRLAHIRHIYEWLHGQAQRVLLEHCNVWNQMHAFAVSSSSTTPDIGWGDRVMQFFGVAFDGCVIDIYPTLFVAGTTLVLTGQDIQETAEKYDVQVIQATPSALATLNPAKLPHLRRVFSAGEALPPALVSPICTLRWGRLERIRANRSNCMQSDGFLPTR